MKTAGCFLYCTKSKTPFYFYSLYNKNETESAAILNNLEEHFYSGDNRLKKGGFIERLKQNSSVFIEGLDCKDSFFFRKLEDEIEDIKTGLLIIYTVTPSKNIPTDFKSLFEVVELEKQPTGATVNNTPLCFTYNKQSRTLTTTNNHGNPMKLSKQRAKLFDLLKKPKDIRLILKKLYSKEIEKNQKITDGKRNTYDSLVCKFNKSWRKHFDLNEELELIKCENEIVSILQNIDWK